MFRRSILALAALLTLAAAPLIPLVGQTPDHQQGLPDPIPPPKPPKPAPESAGNYEPISPDSDLPWGLSEKLVAPLFKTVEVYKAYTRRFSCLETARSANYDDNGSPKKEKLRRYGYLLRVLGDSIFELRQAVARNGSLKPGEVQDSEPFPPAYAWVLLFSRFNQPYFSFRYLGERFDGFDWVHEVQFKGSLAFTDGKDIRQWEGRVLLDAVTHAPLEIVAEPSGQRDRIESLYRRYQSSFNAIGLRTAPKPLGFRARIQFRMLREGLRFPTELRYDTFRAVGLNRIVPTKASTRNYSDYQIQRITVEPRLGEPVESPE